MKPNPKAEQVHQDLTDQIIAALEAGIKCPADFKMPWAGCGDVMRPHNPVTDYNYTAGNRLVLAITSATSGFAPFYATYKQWASLSIHTNGCNEQVLAEGVKQPKQEWCIDHGCHVVNVKKDEKAAARVLRPIIVKQMGDDGIERDKLIGFSCYSVFSATQVAGYEFVPPELPVHDGAAIDQINDAIEWARDAGVTVEESTWDGAHYRPKEDTVVLPSLERWETVDGAWSTMFHEASHWTGHPDRLGREAPSAIINNTTYSKQVYAFEELVAELSAAFCMSNVGRANATRQDHIHYLASWIEVLKDDPKAMYAAAAKAERATAFLFGAHEKKSISNQLTATLSNV